MAVPCSTFTVSKVNRGGLGPARGPFEMALRTYVFSELGSSAEAQLIDGLMQDVLTDALDMVITGFRQCGAVVYGDTSEPGLVLVNGITVHEVATNYRLWVEL